MIATVNSVALLGVEGHVIRVEVNLQPGVPSFTIVGLPDTAVREARERVRAAIAAAGYKWPKRRITVNLAPAGLPKSGSWFDLPIAIGVLVGAGELAADLAASHVVVGELGLDGSVRAVPGVLPAVLCARRAGFAGVMVPAANADEAASVSGLGVHAIDALGGLRSGLPPCYVPVDEPPPRASPLDFGDVAGQALAKFGLLVAAAGNHHSLLFGEPGGGKTMLARCVPSVLPPLTEEERIEASLVHSVAGAGQLVAERPFRSPHHSASMTALVGGGSQQVRPGEVSLAHCGVLFLDELGEFRPHALDALRQPLETGLVQLCRRSLRVELPARFMLVAATNPCPCGFAGSGTRDCRCEHASIARYRRRLSGPLLDRIDLTIPVSPVPAERLLSHRCVPESPGMREAVLAARDRQHHRLGVGRSNGRLTGPEVRESCRLTPEAQEFLESRAARLSSRGVVSLQKVAMTIADLDGKPSVDAAQVEAAWRLRSGALADDAYQGVA